MKRKIKEIKVTPINSQQIRFYHPAADLKIDEKEPLLYNHENARLIHQANELNKLDNFVQRNRNSNLSLLDMVKLSEIKDSGHSLFTSSMAIVEKQGEREVQQGSGCMNQIPQMPTLQVEIKEVAKQQFEWANNYLKARFPVKSQESGTTYERVIIDTRNPRKIRIFTVKAGNGNVFLVSQSKDGKLEVKQADQRDKPDETDEKKRIEGLGGQVVGDRIGKFIPSYQMFIPDLSASAGCGNFKNPYFRREPRKIQCFEFEVKNGECDLKAVVVNCDGITQEHKTIEQTQEVIKSLMDSSQKMARTPEEMAEEFIDLAEKSGSKGNLSAGVIKIDELLKQPPGVYDLLICDGHGKHGDVMSRTVCECHSNLSSNFEVTEEQQEIKGIPRSNSEFSIIVEYFSSPKSIQGQQKVKKFEDILPAVIQLPSYQQLDNNSKKAIKQHISIVLSILNASGGYPLTLNNKKQFSSEIYGDIVQELTKKSPEFKQKNYQDAINTVYKEQHKISIIAELKEYKFLPLNHQKQLNELLEATLSALNHWVLEKSTMDILAEEIRSAIYKNRGNPELSIGTKCTWTCNLPRLFNCRRPRPITVDRLVSVVQRRVKQWAQDHVIHMSVLSK